MPKGDIFYFVLAQSPVFIRFDATISDHRDWPFSEERFQAGEARLDSFVRIRMGAMLNRSMVEEVFGRIFKFADDDFRGRILSVKE